MSSLLGPSDPTADLGPVVLAVSASTWTLGCITIILRFVARRASHAYFWWDDWLIIPAQVATLGGLICAIAATHHGFGRHLAQIDYDSEVYTLKCMFATEFAYSWSIFFIKCSIIALYWRIFSSSFLRIPIILTGLVTALWAIILTFLSIFQCNPVYKIWSVFTPGTCINLQKFWLGSAVPGIATDIVLLLMPLPCVWTLNISRTQKLLCSMLFLLGGFVTIGSIMRFETLFHLDTGSFDVAWNFAPTALWSAVEMNLGVVSACLPCLRPIVNYSRHGSFNSSSSHRSTQGSDAPSRPPWPVRHGPRSPPELFGAPVGSFRQLDDDEGGRGGMLASTPSRKPWGNSVRVAADTTTGTGAARSAADIRLKAVEAKERKLGIKREVQRRQN